MSKFYVFYAKSLRDSFRVPQFVDLDKDFNRIGEFEADSLEELFRMLNAVEEDDLPVKLGIRSMSCGDVVVDETGRGYYCAFIGWSPVAILPTDGAPTTG